jgi:hypothetical protein
VRAAAADGVATAHPPFQGFPVTRGSAGETLPSGRTTPGWCRR